MQHYISEDEIDAALAAHDKVLREARTPYEVTPRDAMKAALEAYEREKDKADVAS